MKNGFALNCCSAAKTITVVVFFTFIQLLFLNNLLLLSNVESIHFSCLFSSLLPGKNNSICLLLSAEKHPHTLFLSFGERSLSNVDER